MSEILYMANNQANKIKELSGHL